MFILIVGAGRVGSSVAKRAIAEGHDVSVLDEDPLSHERLEDPTEGVWEDRGGRFTVGTGLETAALEEAGIDRAEVFVASTNGDNTNLVISQIAQKRYHVGRVVARVLDPARAEWYSERGIEIVSPTRTAIDLVIKAALTEAPA